MSESSLTTPVMVRLVKRPLSHCSDDDDDEADSHSLNNKRLCTDHHALKAFVESENEGVFSQEMTEKHLWLITNHYENLVDWKRICLALGLTVQDVQCIESQHLKFDGLKECFYQSLLKWRMREPENCYLAYLNQVLTFKLGVDSRQTSRLASELVKFEQSLKASRETVDKSEPMSQKHLWTSSGILSQDWKEIARSCLDLKETDISSIERIHLAAEGPRECCYQSLLLWSETGHPRASLSALCSKLAQHKFNLYAKQLLNALRPIM